MFRVALAQMNSGSNWQMNLTTLEQMVAQARRQRAEAILFPENALFMGNPARLYDVAGALQPVLLPTLCTVARKHQIALLLGGHPEKLPGTRKVGNTSLWIDERGVVRARYRKIHLFDVRTPSGGRYAESRAVRAGRRHVIVRWRGVRIGLSICYDLRFPEQYRTLAKRGADCLVIPSAFTHETGRAHWHTLLRARAIENFAVVLAPAQTGRHPMQRRTFGHSLAIDPWGVILSDAGTRPGLTIVHVDPREGRKLRRQIPTLV